MRQRVFNLACASILGFLALGAAGEAQDFQKTYTLPADGILRIRSISGDVRIQGYDGTGIVVEGIKVGRTREKVEIVDRSGENRVDIDVKYPPNCNCDASVNFLVRVPRATKYNFELIKSLSGDVELRDVSGRLKAESISGDVRLENITGTVSASSTSGDVTVQNVSGIVSANSTSGNVDVFLRHIEGTGDMLFSSISGNVAVRVPASFNLDANVTMSTLSGRLTTDFPIEIQQRRYAPGYSARGRLGAGTYNLRITSVSGRVSLTREASRNPVPSN
jgi:DUF4097 and DUF4098 domain-containing protein YvlB